MKVLFVIPAYNEEANIENVIKEIKKDVKYADILIINDCSTDNTKKIIENNNVKCITGIFNLKYAWAVQTGIKYAYQNDYDYEGDRVFKVWLLIRLRRRQVYTNLSPQ